MSGHAHAQVKPASSPSPKFTPAPSRLLQRKCACGGTPGVVGMCRVCRRKRLGLQRYATDQIERSEVPPIVHEVLQSPGKPLDAATRTLVESRFGHDFSQVRVHTDGQAVKSARAVNAVAYTVGRDIVVGAKEYAPSTLAGLRLLSHELVHVLQQGNPAVGVRAAISIGPSGDDAEQQADQVANEVATYGRTLGRMLRSTRTHLQRDVLGNVFERVKTFLDLVQLAASVGNGAIFDGSALLIVEGGKITNRFRAVSGHGGSEWEENVGPIPDGDYWIQPQKINKTVTTIEPGTGGANAISSGYQPITVTKEKPCDPSWEYCTIDCSAAHGTGAKCWNTTTVWGNHRIKIEPGRVRVRTPGGDVVVRSGFYIHGGAGSVNVTSGCIKVFDDAAFIELQKWKKKVPLVVKK
jgi:hypothetical protein